jgi:hypothetical protein
MVDFGTPACTTADRANPRINAHKISQVIDPARASADPIATTIPAYPVRSGQARFSRRFLRDLEALDVDGVHDG